MLVACSIGEKASIFFGEYDKTFILATCLGAMKYLVDNGICTKEEVINNVIDNFSIIMREEKEKRI